MKYFINPPEYNYGQKAICAVFGIHLTQLQAIGLRNELTEIINEEAKKFENDTKRTDK